MEYVKQGNLTVISQIAKYAGYLAVVIIMAQASVMQVFYPFALGIYMAFLWCNEKIWLIAPIYIIGTVIASPTIVTLVSSITTVVVSVIMYALHARKKKSVTITAFTMYAIISQMGYVASEIIWGAGALHAVITVIIAIIFMLAAKTTAEVIIIRGVAHKLNTNEIISALFVVGAVASGLTTINIAGFEIVKLVACVAILLTSSVIGTAGSLLTASSIGLGALIATGNTELLTPVIVWALVASALRTKQRIFPVVAVLITEAFLGWMLNVYYSYQLMQALPVVIGALITLALPQEIISRLKQFFNLADNDIAMRNVVNRSRESLCRRLLNLSDVFNEMDYVFRSTIKNSMSKSAIKSILLSNVRAQVCKGCKHQHSCHKMCGDYVDSVLEGLIETAIEKGKISVLDLPPYITTRCGRVSMLVIIINQLTAEYAQSVSNTSGIDAGKILIAEQLAGVSKIMKNLAGEVKRNITFDSTRENEIIDELAFNNIICSDAVIYEENQHTVSVTLVVRKTDTNKKILTSIVSKICQCEMAVTDITSSQRAGWNVLTFVTAPKLTIAFGTASVKKATSSVSGDCYSIIHVTNDRYLLALCDGMGSGEKAQHASSVAIGLVENFYKVGFDNETILSSINKLLTVNSQDVFSALDICVVDVRTAICDFVKMGAAASLIRHNNQTQVINGQALPLGIVQNVTPSVTQHSVTSGDLVFMVTDGVSDCFESDDAFRDFINNLPGTNPQTLAEEIIAHCLALSNNYARDDMTVIVARVY